MKLKHIHFIDCPIFENLKLDFTNERGMASDTVIIAGENGVGKSLLLETILNHHIPIRGIDFRQEVHFQYELTTQEAEKIDYEGRTTHRKDRGNILEVKSTKYQEGSVYGGITEMLLNGEKLRSLSAKNIHSDVEKMRTVMFSAAEINHTADSVKNVTNLDIDGGIKAYKRNNELASTISQLLVNIESLDAIDFAKWAKRKIREQVDYSRVDRRMKRFTAAFDDIFPTKKFKEIQQIEDEKKVVFEENGRTMSINELSSGEKQIVFRGGLILQNLSKLENSIMLFDEPEISLHPSWQMKIVDYYKKMITDIDGYQTAQIFVATHSPFILHNYLRKNDKVIIIKKNTQGALSINEKNEYFGWTSEKIVEDAFDIRLSETGRGTLFVEGETDELYIKKCLQIFSISNFPNDIKWVGRKDAAGNPNFSGDTALNHVTAFFLANEQFLKAPVVLLYDNDTKKEASRSGNLIVEVFPFQEGNSVFKKGIENLLVLPADFKYDSFYSESIKVDDYGASSLLRKLDKKALCEYICNNLEDSKKVFQKINDFLVTLQEKYK